ncbi:Channel protein, hemolysin III family [Desulfonema limicola]|uniref:Channel protein, hemolysin III family n=1 Tax=Desulfonema limicola TaxID=45656 RepID=A0A975B6M3_9BACT|nr:hemolysin III family protein [Desulfonema limicola]QTA79793.1 Channel protein, hemolysin III family [Desulfonema limicola]
MYKGEGFNSITHLIGAALALIGMVLLIVLAARQGEPWKIVSFSIYGTTLLLLYTFSTLYHSLEGKAKNVFHKLDHLAIYLLIAGTYTPFTLITLRGRWGWSIFGAVWCLAIAGIILDSLHREGQRILPLIIYLFMGWLIMIALKPLLLNLTLTGLLWLLTGGIFYTVGVIFYCFDEKVRHFHGIWHLFVLAGSITHYLTVIFYVL